MLKKRLWLFALAAMLISAHGLAAEEITAPSSALREYVAKPDNSYKWTVRREGELAGVKYAELILTSQTWRDIVWKHQLFVMLPETEGPPAKHALLFITGGGWKPELEQPPTDDRLPRDATLFATLAQQMKTPVAILLHVPQQPIFDGKVEDQIIALTFEKYLQTRDSEWPLLLPMVKSAVRAMDAVQEVGRDRLGATIETFTVSGASKRGWTTWLTGAVDERATALAPMVIDMLNMAPQLKHQRESFGAVSEEINDYTQRGLLEHMESEAGAALRSIVDPYCYRHTLVQPKLILLGTNDNYWPLDALNLYWDGLQGEKHILYVPNNGHGLQDLGRITGALAAIHRRGAEGKPLPKLSWDFAEQGDGVTLTVSSDVAPSIVNVWLADSATRDFRQSKWRSLPAKANGGEFSYVLSTPAAGFSAMFGEAVFDGESLPLFLSTNVRIVKSKK